MSDQSIERGRLSVHRDEASGWLVLSNNGKPTLVVSPEAARALREEIGRIYRDPCPCNHGQVFNGHRFVAKEKSLER